MTFHEKSAWIMALLLTAVAAWYLNAVWHWSVAIGQAAPPNIFLVAVATVMLVAGVIMGHVIVAISNPMEADAPEDERDKQVLRRAGNIAGYVLGFGCFAGLWSYFAQSDGNLLFHIVVLSLIVSQISEYVLTIFFYRRGA